MTVLHPTQSPSGYSAQPSMKAVDSSKASLLAVPRKTEKSDSFEKQPQPPASVEKGPVVPTLIGTAILSPLLGALAGEWAWQGLASDEKTSISTPFSTEALDEEGIPNPQVFVLEKFKTDVNFAVPRLCMELDLQKTKHQNADNIEAVHPVFSWFVEREKRFYTPIKGVNDIHNIMKTILRKDLTEYLCNLSKDRLIGKDNNNFLLIKINNLLEEHPTINYKASQIVDYLEKLNLLRLQEFSELETELNQLIKSHDSTSSGKFTVENFEQEVFDRIQEGLQACKEKAKNSPNTPTTQTVETTVKEGVQTLKELGSWFRTPTETLHKAGGVALEKHATNSRWIAGGVALATLLLEGGLAYFSNPKKPKNQSIDAN